MSAAVSVAQHERRGRILDATVTHGRRGGFDAVQMRSIAADAHVALGTLYRYFPSKVHLLLAVLDREVTRARDRIDRAILRGANPYDRLMVTLGALGKSLQRDPLLTEAMTRALMFADRTASAEVDTVRALIDETFARALSNGDPHSADLAVAQVVSDVWLASLVARVTGRTSPVAAATRLELTARLLVGGRSAIAGDDLSAALPGRR